MMFAKEKYCTPFTQRGSPAPGNGGHTGSKLCTINLMEQYWRHPVGTWREKLSVLASELKNWVLFHAVGVGLLGG